MTIDGRIGLNLFRDGKRPAVLGGKFGPSEQMRNPGALEQAVVLDRLDGGVGAVERQVPNTYPLAIDGCTRFGRAWTPSGYITDLPPLAPFDLVPPGTITGLLPFRGVLLVGAGRVIYGVGPDELDVAIPLGVLANPNEVVCDMVEFQGLLCIGTTNTLSGQPGHLYIWDGTALASGTTIAQHLYKTYQVIDDLGSSRLVGNNTLFTFKFIAATDPPGSVTMIDFLLDGSNWVGPAGTNGYQVGDTSAPITNIGGSPLVVFFAKTDGVYHVGPDGRAARIVDWSDSQHRTNGQVFKFAYGGMYASNFRWGLVRVDVANLQVQWQTNACGPGVNLPRVVPSTGLVTAITLDGEWIVIAQWNGRDSYTFYARPVEITERVAMINIASPQALNWHGSEGTFWGKQVTQLEVVVLGSGTSERPLLFVGWQRPDGTPGLSHVSLPKLGTPLEDWLVGGPHRFQPSSWLYFPRQDWGDERGGPFGGWASVRKVFNRLDLSADYLERYACWVDAYMANTGGHGLFYDRALSDGEDGYDPLRPTLWTGVGRFDEGDRISMVPGKTIQSGLKAALMLRGHCEPNHPFAFYGAKLRGTPMIEQSERRQYRVTFGRSRKANQGQDHREILSIMNEMWALQWADPVSLSDQYRLPLVVDVEPTMSYEDTTEPSTGEPTVVVTFTCRVVRRGFFWGAGYRWGGEIVWSGGGPTMGPPPPTE